MRLCFGLHILPSTALSQVSRDQSQEPQIYNLSCLHPSILSSLKSSVWLSALGSHRIGCHSVERKDNLWYSLEIIGCLLQMLWQLLLSRLVQVQPILTEPYLSHKRFSPRGPRHACASCPENCSMTFHSPSCAVSHINPCMVINLWTMRKL